MPSKQIRAAVAAYFQGTPGLSQLAKDEPWFQPGQAWVNNGVEGTAGFIHIDNQSEQTVTLRGPGLQERAVTYDVAVVIQYQYRIPVDTPPTMDSWVDGLDDLLDALVTKIRADPTLGCGPVGPVWQGGTENMDLQIQRNMPVRDGGKVWSVNYVMFKVTEIIIPTI